MPKNDFFSGDDGTLDDDFFATMQSLDLFEDDPEDPTDDFFALTQELEKPADLQQELIEATSDPFEKDDVSQAVFAKLFSDQMPEQEDIAEPKKQYEPVFPEGFTESFMKEKAPKEPEFTAQPVVMPELAVEPTPAPVAEPTPVVAPVEEPSPSQTFEFEEFAQPLPATDFGVDFGDVAVEESVASDFAEFAAFDDFTEPAPQPVEPVTQPESTEGFASNLQALLMGDQVPVENASPVATGSSYVDDAPTREFSSSQLTEPKPVAPNLDGFESMDFDAEPEPQAIDFDLPVAGAVAGAAGAAYVAATHFDEQQVFEQPSEEMTGLDNYESDLWDTAEQTDELDMEEYAAEPAKKTAKRPAQKKTKQSSNLPLVILLILLIIAIICVAGYALFGGKDTPPATSGSTSQSQSDSTTGDMTAPDSTSEPTEPVEPEVVVQPIPRDEWYMVVANTTNVLSESFAVTTAKTSGGIEVDSRIADVLDQMVVDAKAQGVNLKIVSGYRTYARQKASYDAGYTTAAPGTSDHNTGLGVDIQSTTSFDYANSFGDSAEAKWLRANAAAYGFIERYPAGSKGITGFDPEPWHYRYVGVDQAQKIVASGLTFEEYLAQDAPTGVPTV